MGPLDYAAGSACVISVWRMVEYKCYTVAAGVGNGLQAAAEQLLPGQPRLHTLLYAPPPPTTFSYASQDADQGRSPRS